MDAVTEEIKKNKVKLIIVATDASEKTIKNIAFLADQKNIPVATIGKISDNSKSIGKENRAIIGVKDKNIADGLIKIIYGGEAFGENESL